MHARAHVNAEFAELMHAPPFTYQEKERIFSSQGHWRNVGRAFIDDDAENQSTTTSCTADNLTCLKTACFGDDDDGYSSPTFARFACLLF